MLKSVRGFSMIEMLVVLAILGVIMGVAIPAFSEWIGGTRLRMKAESLLGGISLARSHALKRNSRVFFQFGTDSSWTVGCVTPIALDRDGDGVADCPATIEQKAASEGGTGVQFTVTPTGTNMLTYSGIGRLVANADASASVTQVDLSLSGLATVWRVVISGTGQARVCNPAFDGSGDANACA